MNGTTPVVCCHGLLMMVLCLDFGFNHIKGLFRMDVPIVIIANLDGVKDSHQRRTCSVGGVSMDGRRPISSNSLVHRRQTSTVGSIRSPEDTIDDV